MRAEEKGTALAFLNIKEISYARFSPPLVDEDWHAVCQALNRSLEADEWSKMYDTWKELKVNRWAGGLLVSR